MNYEKNYFDYINYVRTLKRDRKDGIYYELHHILPRSMGGKNNIENLILLTFREHYLAHFLLWKIYKNNKMLCSFIFMCGVSAFRDFKINSKLFQKAKEEFSKKQSIKVVCLETGVVYNSMTSAAEENNIVSHFDIRIAIRDKKRTSVGYHWECYDETVDYTKNEFYGRGKKRFTLIRLEDLKTYYGYKEAAVDNNCKIGTISTVISKKNMTANGYHWDHYNETIDYTKSEFYGKERKIDVNMIKVVCLETGVVFKSLTEASKFAEIKISSDIRRSCLDKQATAGGYHWNYYNETVDYTKNEFYGREKKKGIKVICIETNEVYVSLKNAAESIGFNSSSLVDHLKGRQKTFGGFHWKKIL